MVGLQFMGGKYVRPICGFMLLKAGALMFLNLLGFLRAAMEYSSATDTALWNLGFTTLEAIGLFAAVIIIFDCRELLRRRSFDRASL
jgi:hypothetical protein